MASGPTSFIDIAVLEDVRGRFAAGDALAILSLDLEEVIWANGPGAALLGYPDIEAVMGASPNLTVAARRQISATSGFPRIGRDRPVAVRLASGASSRLAPFLASFIILPDATPGILLALKAQEPAAQDADEAAARAIQGFGEAGYFAALLRQDAKPAAASPRFDDLGIAPETLAGLIDEVARENDRLVKRMIPSASGMLPAGMARLTDDPALHLLLTVGDPARRAPTAEPSVVIDTDDAPAPSDADLPDLVSEAIPHTSSDAPDQPTEEDETNDWYFSDDSRDAAPRPDPVRFVWRTDADAAFSSVSEEFVQAVGPDAANVIGRRFRDVAEELEIDPDGEIGQLLERRDTWSGRTVSWPLAGTDLAVPVDLAALPVYDRDRVFEGFRGFGVVRMGEAARDPAARGMRFGGHDAQDEEITDIETPEDLPDPFQGEVPVISITERMEQRRESDKVIRLAEHRFQQHPERRLSSGEKNAFEEIRARLREDFAPEKSPPAENEPPVTAEDRPGDFVDETAPEAEAGPVEPPVPEKADPAIPEKAEPEEAPVASWPIATSGFIPSALSGTASESGVDSDLIAGLPIPLLVHAGDELYFANREFLALTGYASLDQIRREGGLDRLFVDHDSSRDGDSEEKKLHLRTLGGEEFPVDAHLQSIRWRDGSALLLALRRPEVAAAPPPATPAPPPVDDGDAHVAMLRTIIDTATDGVVLIAPDGTIRNISRPAEALFGFDSAHVEGEPFIALFAIESRKAAQDYLAGLAGNGVASVLNDGREVIGREAQGRFIPLFMTIGKLPGDSGYCAVLRDITQWKRAEEDLTQARSLAERASSQKTEFLARVSHEIRTPLNAIIGFSELMIDEKFGPIGSDRYRDYLRDINRSGNHVLDLVNDLLDISKIEAGEQEMNYEAVSLNDTLAETVAMMQPQANRERVIIRSSLASSLPEVVADLRSVRQIALNLLSNAIRYTQAGGQVIVSTAYEGSGDVAMRVRDTGIGMTLSEIDQALKPFKQINALKRGRRDGTGLGLPLTKAMVEANRARFTITSTPGEGTMVEVVFPSTRVLAD